MTDQQAYRIMISGGGTGGHIFPALAIADALKSSGRAIKFLFVGAKGRMEMEKVPAAGYEIVGLPVAGIQRKFTLSNILIPFRLMASLFKAVLLVFRFKPDIAVGTGGYASGPVLFIASLMRVPTLIQEQNSYAGITNKILARRAIKICVAYPGMDKFFPADKVHYTGNPVRAEITGRPVSTAEARSFFKLDPGKKTILIIGGSLGARTINNTLKDTYRELLSAGYQLIWQTGKIYHTEIMTSIGPGKVDGLCLLEFIREMDKAYAVADVIISRAGANSISELCMAGKPVILVPSPNVAEDHQTSNAMALSSAGAAILVKDADAPAILLTAVLELIRDEEKCRSLSTNIRAMAKPDATTDITNDIWEILDQKRNNK